MIDVSIYDNEDIKVSILIEEEGFTMADNDFFVLLSNAAGSRTIRIEKADMKLHGGVYYFICTSEQLRYLGNGGMYVTTFAFVPDSDFELGIRKSVNTQLLGVIKTTYGRA